MLIATIVSRHDYAQMAAIFAKWQRGEVRINWRGNVIVAWPVRA